MKNLFYIFVIAMLTPLLGGCLDKGSSAPPPSNFNATAGNGRVTITWTPDYNVNYWIFTATDPSLTAFNWLSLPNAHVYTSASTPFYMCGLISGMPYYFAANGRVNGGPGGPSSATVAATPYDASATWTANPALSTQNLLGVGYTSLSTCTNNTSSYAGSFAAVGAGGVIYTSADGKTWSAKTSPIATALNAVTGYAANQNNPSNPGLRWVAVGDGGASVYSTDGTTWSVGNAFNPGNQALRSITQVAGSFFAVGDAGTILSTTDGITWTSHTSGTANNLNGITHGSIYVAVGNSGTILTSADGNTWISQAASPPTASNLRQVAAYGSLIVAVGDTGTIVTSKDNGATWYMQTLGTANLAGVTAEMLVYDPANAAANTDAWLNAVPGAQFVVINSSGSAYASVVGANPGANGLSWSTAIPIGITSANALLSSGFGYVAAGNAGATAYAF